MKKLIFPVVLGIIVGCLVGIGFLWLEFGMVTESFVNYRP